MESNRHMDPFLLAGMVAVDGDAPPTAPCWFRSSLPGRSLASIRAGERVRVGRILFEGVRERCAEWQIEEGAELVCWHASGDGLLVAIRGGAIAWIDPGPARFVEVSTVKRRMLRSPGHSEHPWSGTVPRPQPHQHSRLRSVRSRAG